MIKRVLQTIILLILLSVGMYCTVHAGEDEDVICNLDSLINGTYYQGADIYETALGDFTADAVKFASGADAAFVNAADLNAVLDAGEVRREDVERVFAENRRLGVTRMSAEQIWDMLEYNASFIKVGADEKTDKEASSFAGCLQVSGIKYEFDATAPEGSRLKYLILGDTQVNRHDNRTFITVCAALEMLDGGYGFTPVDDYETLNITLADALEDYLRDGDYEATTIISDRSKVKGTLDRPLVSRGMWLVIGGLMCLSGFFFNKFKKRIAPDRSFYHHVDPNL